MRTAVEFVTPEQASRWLESGRGLNRPIGESDVLYLVREIQRGNWQLTHQGIARTWPVE